MALDQELISLTHEQIIDLTELLNAGNDIRKSTTRLQILSDIEFQDDHLTFAIQDDNPDDLQDVADAIQLQYDLIEHFQEVALLEFAADYGLFLGGFAANSKSHYADFYFIWKLLVPKAFKPPGGKPPDTLVIEYEMMAAAAIDGILLREETTLRKLKDLGCLAPDDYNRSGVALHVSLDLAKIALAVNQEYVRRAKLKQTLKTAQQRLKNSQPGIGRRIWSFVGWDSGWDFLTDVVLIGATGGFGAAARWGKRTRRLARSINVNRKTAKRLRKQIDELHDEVQRLRKHEQALRKQANRIHQLSSLQMRIRRVFNRMLRRIDDLKGIKQFIDDNVKELIKDPKAIISSIAQTVAADLGLKASGVKTDKSRVVASELVQRGIRAKLDAHPPFSQLDDMRDRFTREMLISGHDRAAQEWIGTLIAREILVRLIENAAHKRTSLSASDSASIIISGFGKAAEIGLLDLGLPEKIVKPIAVNFVKIARKYTVGAISALAKQIIKSI